MGHLVRWRSSLRSARRGLAVAAGLGLVAAGALLTAPVVSAAAAPPAITTVLSTSSLVLNYPVNNPDQVTDSVTVTGEPDVTGLYVYVHLYKESGTPPTPDPTPIATWEVPLSSTGTATTPPYLPESAGPFCFQASFKGAANDTPISTTSCEILNVTEFPASLTTSPTSSGTGASAILADTADLTIYPTKPAEGGSGDYGSVIFTLYSDPSCADAVGVTSPTAISYTGANFQAVGSLTFATLLPAGTYYWIAAYSGNYDNLAYSSSCGEPITVGGGGVLGATTPTISTDLSSSAITVLGSVFDSATLVATTSNAAGTVTYTVYSDNACSDQFESAGTVSVTNGIVPPSNSLVFATAGTYYWQASYSGDSSNGAATSTCNSETLVVSAAGGSGTLAASVGTPTTGSDLGGAGLIGALLIVMGVLLLGAERRLRHSSTRT